MKTTLRLSIAINLLLASALAALVFHESQNSHSLALQRRSSSDRIAIAPNPESLPGPSPFSGRKISPSTVAALEQLGIPRETVVNVLVEDFNRRSTQKIAALQKRYAPRLVPDREMIEFSRQTDLDRANELKQALGEEGYRAWDKEQTLNELNRARSPGDSLPMTPAEAEQAYRLQKDFDDKAKELQMAMEDGVADRADVGTLQAQAQQALDQQLEKLLGRQRFNELRGIVDPTTQVYRAYGDLNPTRDQAKAVLAAQKEYQDRHAALQQTLAGTSATAAEITGQLKSLDDAQDEQMRKIFGADAYAKMKQQSDPTYKTLKQYADAWDLKDGQIDSVYQTVHTFQDEVDRTRAAAELSQSAGEPVNWRQINSTIEQSRQQTEAGLKNLIGPDRLRRLEQNGVLSNG